MVEVGNDFDRDLVSWWPASAPLGEPPDEPDMPHDSYFEREMTMYVDFTNFGTPNWSVADPLDHPTDFDAIDGLRDVAADARDHLASFEKLLECGALAFESLKAFNSIWRGRNLVRRTGWPKVVKLWQKTAEEVSKIANCLLNELLDSPLCSHPCYDFVINPTSPLVGWSD